MNYRLLTSFLSLPLAACSGNILLPSQQESIRVDSVPVGASVLVLGEAMGQTPINLTTRDVFPQSYDHEKQHLYGRIELSHPGCAPFITTVNTRIISEGLNAHLKCAKSESPDKPTTTSPKTAPVAVTAQGQPITIKQRLRQAKELFDEGLISEQEYAEKRRQLLEEL